MMPWAALVGLGLLHAQDPRTAASPDAPHAMMGRELYEQACARCHGSDGRGMRQDIQLNAPMPNFARCAESAEETDAQWRRTIDKGGVVYGLSDQMPAYGEVLTGAQIESLLVHLREFCTDRRWVRGELNFRRTLFTEKAYPENELVLSPRLERSSAGGPAFEWLGLLERRIGPRTQVEVALPLRSIDAGKRSGSGYRESGPGDLEVGIKQVVFDSLQRGVVASAGLDVAFPTGRRGTALGAGTAIFEPFVAAGAARRGWTFQGTFRLELPADTRKAEREAAWSLAAGRPVVFLREVRDLFATLEAVGTRELVRGEPSRIFLVPQLRLPIDRLGRWAVAAGPVIPVKARGASRVGFAAYLLYEYLGR